MATIVYLVQHNCRKHVTLLLVERLQLPATELTESFSNVAGFRHSLDSAHTFCLIGFGLPVSHICMWTSFWLRVCRVQHFRIKYLLERKIIRYLL